jgi:predicted nucleic acid-binding protein
VRLVADANVLLSAVLGGRAKLVFGQPGVEEVLTTAFTLGEVQEYAEQLARAKRLSLDTVLLAAATLPVTIVERHVYSESLPEAERRIGQRDPEDADVLALALHLKVPVWSNDRDFEGTGVERYTTAQLLRKLSTE